MYICVEKCNQRVFEFGTMLFGDALDHLSVSRAAYTFFYGHQFESISRGFFCLIFLFHSLYGNNGMAPRFYFSALYLRLGIN